jgi:hypothetical protein
MDSPAMRTKLFLLAWTFVILVAAYDSFFAWDHRDQFALWEMNPIACWVARLFGLGAVLLVKIATIAFGASVATYCHQRRHSLEAPYTLVVGGLHLALSVHYLIGQLIC